MQHLGKLRQEDGHEVEKSATFHNQIKIENVLGKKVTLG